MSTSTIEQRLRPLAEECGQHFWQCKVMCGKDTLRGVNADTVKRLCDVVGAARKLLTGDAGQSSPDAWVPLVRSLSRLDEGEKV